MKVVELIEWLKREDPLAEVQIEIIDPEYPMITTWSSPIDRVYGLEISIQVVRLLALRQGKMVRKT